MDDELFINFSRLQNLMAYYPHEWDQAFILMAGNKQDKLLGICNIQLFGILYFQKFYQIKFEFLSFDGVKLYYASYVITAC